MFGILFPLLPFLPFCCPCCPRKTANKTTRFSGRSRTEGRVLAETVPSFFWARFALQVADQVINRLVARLISWDSLRDRAARPVVSKALALAPLIISAGITTPDLIFSKG